jgi:caffeoyl-CoA O-methyltransferase
MNDTAGLVAILVRAIRATRVLEIGTGAATSGLLIADALPATGMLITLERDAAVATQARHAFAAAGHAHKASVMIGDASRFLHKISGPFDLIVQDSDVTAYGALHDRLVRLLGPSATLVTHNMSAAGDYNEVLAADARLTTIVLNLGAGVAISVRRQD